MPEIAGKRLQIGGVVFDPLRQEIIRDGSAQALEPRLVRLLEALCDAGGEPVTREALLAAVSAMPFSGDEALTQAMSRLRSALGDSSRAPQYIKTIPRRGYALIAPVSAAGSASQKPAGHEQAAVIAAGWTPDRVLILTLALAILALVALLAWHQLNPKETVIETELLLGDDTEFLKKKREETAEP